MGAAILLRTAAARAVPPDFYNQAVVPGIVAATTMAFLPDGRMLVGEINETIWVVQPGASAPDPVPFLQIPQEGLFDEQGLMDIRPDPNFSANHYFYVFYTHTDPSLGNFNRLSRFTASGNGTVPGSELVLWQDNVVAEGEHHGGAIAFGTDGKLYFTYGDQFIATTSQQLNSYRGKLLRINPDGTIPTDNPFYDGPGPHKDAIWAYGLRNPYRMSIDPVTGRIYIGDVGGNDPSTAFEEVNVGAAGANYGWPLCEGPCGLPGVTSPIYAYPHSGRDACITGGFVYRGSQFPSQYVGSYFFADYVQNWIKRLTFDGSGNLTGVVNFEPVDGSPDGPYGDPVKLIEGPDGALYYVDIGFNDQHVPNEAALRRISYSPSNQPPIAVASANPVSGQAPLLVTFSSAGSSDPEAHPLSYSWDFGDGASSTEASPTHTYAAEGPYVALLTVSDGVNSTVSDQIDISVGNAPTVTILTPSDGSLFRAGDVIAYSGSATDVEDGTLPASAFSWTIFFHHDTHIHPGGTFANTTTGTLTIPTSGHDFQGSTNYQIVLTVTDSDGLKGSDSVTVYPDKVNISFNTNPTAFSIDLDGIRKVAPFSYDDVIGFTHVINAPVQVSGGLNYWFKSWSDGGAASHQIVVPEGGGSWLARFWVPPPSSDLVAAYSFDEGSGGTVGDVSGNSNDGSLVGAVWTGAGHSGSALSFSSAGDLVIIPDSSSLDLTTAMTLEAWVNPTEIGNWRDVIYKGSNDIYYLMGSSSQGDVPATGGTFAANPLYSGGATLPIDTWSHLAATYDRTTLRLFVNGAEVASRAENGLIQTSTDPLTIGGDFLYGQWFAGRIDDVRIYNRALTLAEIQADMVAPVGSAQVPALPALGVAALAAGLLAGGLSRSLRRGARAVGPSSRHGRS